MELSKDAIGLIGCVALILLVFAGVRVYLAAALVGLVGIVAIIGWKAGAGIVGTIPHSKSVNYTLSVLPLFILIGYLAYHAGITQALFDAAKKWMGWMPGGLAIATIFAVAALLGRVGSVHGGRGRVRARRHPGDAEGRLRQAPGGRRGLRGRHARRADPAVGHHGGLRHHRRGIDRQADHRRLHSGASSRRCATRSSSSSGASPIPTVGKPIRGFTWAERFASVPGTLPVMAVIVIIFSAMYYGWATPTEAGALGAFVVYVLALIKGMKWKPFNDALLETAKLTVMIFAIIWGILIFVRFLGFAGVPEKFSEWVVSLPLPRVVIMVGILGVYLILGCFMDAIGMMLLTLPVVYPAVMKLGYDPIWFGIIVVKMAGVCLLTPPIGLNCFVVAAVRPDIPLSTVFRGALPFVIADFLAIAIFLAWPETITWLPDQMMK